MELKYKLTSLVISLSGILFSLISIIRYYILYPDLDKVIAYVFIGFLLMALGWTHNRLEMLTKENEEQWKHDDLIKEMLNKEIEKGGETWD